MRRECRERFPLPPRFSDPDMHHGTCVTHVPCCMSGSLTSSFLWNRWRGKRSRHSRRMRNPQFCVSGKRPMVGPWVAHWIHGSQLATGRPYFSSTGVIVSQITGISTVCSRANSCWNQRKHQSNALWALERNPPVTGGFLSQRASSF